MMYIENIEVGLSMYSWQIVEEQWLSVGLEWI